MIKKQVKKTKCDFCQYKSRSGCMVKPDSFYCKAASDEFYAWLKMQKEKNKNFK